MSSSKPFPLLHLPRLPLFKVFNCLGVQEQFYLSFCSKKSKYAIKFYTDRQKYSVTFYFEETFAFSLKTTNSKFLIDVQTHTPIFGSMWTFLSRVENEAPTNEKRLLLFLLDVFNTPEICLVFDGRRHQFVKGFINFIHSLKMNIQTLKINSMSDKTGEFVLDNCRDVSEVLLECFTSTSFEYLNKSLIPKFSFDKLTINYANWVTTRHLSNLFINCKHVILYGCSPQKLEIQQFIKKWIYGYSQLTYASLAFNYVDFFWNDIMREVPSTIVPIEEIGEAFFTNPVYRIKQEKTGVQAYVIMKNDRTIVITDSLNLF
ncbi:hypothetical protein CRE_08431 [Caenorhabditis remanei]|uniref:Uncharacterized protein n=1 Tax=Caenorhabditis remanei TaxID=31234 RepID=E3MZZ3_CAERE|nr:hypothetical protein CRE_08431 [Caenorhabditis remanei]